MKSSRHTHQDDDSKSKQRRTDETEHKEEHPGHSDGSQNEGRTATDEDMECNDEGGDVSRIEAREWTFLDSQERARRSVLEGTYSLVG